MIGPPCSTKFSLISIPVPSLLKALLIWVTIHHAEMNAAQTFISPIRWDIRGIWQGYMMRSVKENKETGLKNWGLKADHYINTILLTLVYSQMSISELLYTFLMALSRSTLVFVVKSHILYFYTPVCKMVLLCHGNVGPFVPLSVHPLVEGLNRLLPMVDFFHFVIQSH